MVTPPETIEGICEICGGPSEMVVHFKTHCNEIIPMRMCTECFFKLMGVVD